MEPMKGEQMSLAVETDGPNGFHAFEGEGYTRGFKLIAGVDEVGRGPLAGPVVAAAVILPRGFSHPEIRDSKLLSMKQREKLAAVIQQSATCWAIGVVDVKEIDQLNIHQASLLAMVKALRLLRIKPDCALIDGNQTIPAPLFRLADFFGGRTVYQRTIIKGDQSCISIAAASIIAKVARDDMMLEYHSKYPEYGFADHKGYSCDRHFEALRCYGPSPIHRRSFKPVREVLAQQTDLGPLFEG
jgi:ribonuclease HII